MRPMEIEPDIYFGNPGQLVKLPWPKGGLDAPVDVQTFDFVSGTGTHRISRLVGTSRAYSLAWNALHQSTFDKVNQYYIGINGRGPFAIVDPSRPNMLTPNQASATGFWNDGTDFTPASNSGVVSSNTDPNFVLRGGSSRSLFWSFAGLNSIASPCMLTLNSPLPGRWLGYPVVPSRNYAFAFSAYYTSGSISVAIRLMWIDINGVTISESITNQNVSAGWTSFNKVAMAPPNAAYVAVRVSANAILNANPFFEANATNWTTTSGTIARDNTQAHQGAWSLKLTPDGTSLTNNALSEMVPVIGNTTYRVKSWLYSALGHNGAVLAVNWYNSGAGLIATTIDSFTIPATTWTQRVDTFLSPAGAVSANISISQNGTPPASHILWADEATLAPESGGLYLDMFQLEMADAVYDWAPGTGSYAVGITGWNESMPFDSSFRTGPTLSLREVQ